MAKRAVGYIRISQPDEDPGNQRFVIERWARENGYEIVFMPPEQYTGEEDPFRRPVFRMAVEFAKMNNIDTIVMTDIQRFSRKYEYTLTRLADLASQGIRLIFVNTPIPTLEDFYEAITRAFSNIPKNNPYMEVMMRVIKDIMFSIIRLAGEITLRLFAAQSEAYLQEVRLRSKTKIERLREEGRLFHRPDMIWYYASWLYDKKPSDLTKEEYEAARRRLREILEKYLAQGYSRIKAYEMMLGRDLVAFAEKYRGVLPKSREAIYRTINKILAA